MVSLKSYVKDVSHQRKQKAKAAKGIFILIIFSLYLLCFLQII